MFDHRGKIFGWRAALDIGASVWAVRKDGSIGKEAGVCHKDDAGFGLSVAGKISDGQGAPAGEHKIQNDDRKPTPAQRLNRGVLTARDGHPRTLPFKMAFPKPAQIRVFFDYEYVHAILFCETWYSPLSLPHKW